MRKCCLCGNASFTSIFDLGPLPLGFPIDLESQAKETVWRKKYTLVLCNRCLLGQTIHKIPDEPRKTENLYLSKHTRVVSDHDQSFTKHVPPRLSLSKKSLIMEIGCGDGSLLELFQKSGYSKLFGIEPSPHLGNYPFEVVADYFNSKVAMLLKTQNKRPDLVIANYVIELVPNLREFFEDLVDLMKDGAFLILEVPYLNSFLSDFRLDGFAHLRCNWFTIGSLVWTFKTFGFKIIDFVLDEHYRGGTLKAIVQKRSTNYFNISVDLSERIKKEKDELSPLFFSFLQSRINSYCNLTRAAIDKLCQKGIPIYGYGGGLKASTIVNLLRLTTSQIRMTIDIDPNKQNKVIPVANIPIRPLEELPCEGNEPIGVIILALDHLQEVEDFLKSRLKKGSFLIYVLPEYRIIKI